MKAALSFKPPMQYYIANDYSSIIGYMQQPCAEGLNSTLYQMSENSSKDHSLLSALVRGIGLQIVRRGLIAQRPMC